MRESGDFAWYQPVSLLLNLAATFGCLIGSAHKKYQEKNKNWNNSTKLQIFRKIYNKKISQFYQISQKFTNFQEIKNIQKI